MLPRHVVRSLGSSLAAGFLLVGSIGSTATASDAADATVSAGALALSPAPVILGFSVTLDGTARSMASSMDGFAVTDARGTGAGWAVTVQATTFREWDGAAYVAGGRTLPNGSLAMAAPAVAPTGTDSPGPVVAPGSQAIDGATIVLARAAADTGMGTYTFTPGDLALTVPASTYAGTYRSEIAVTVASGP